MCVGCTLGVVTQKGSVVPEYTSAVMPGTSSHHTMQPSPQALQNRMLQSDHLRFKNSHCMIHTCCSLLSWRTLEAD